MGVCFLLSLDPNLGWKLCTPVRMARVHTCKSICQLYWHMVTPVSTAMPLRWRGPESLRPDAAASLWHHDAAAYHYMHLMTL